MDGLLVVDSAGNITLINEPAAELVGISMTAASFLTIASSIDLLSPRGELLSPEQWPSHRALRGEFMQEFEVQIRRKDTGATTLVEISTLPIKDRAGSTTQFVVAYRNISERDRIEAERALSAAIIEGPRIRQSRKLEAIGQLAGGVAHDFNNLLAVVLGALELQRKRISDDPESMRFWEMANKAATRGADLTRRLLAFSNMKQFKFAPTAVDPTVRNMVALASRLVGPEIEITLNLSESMPPVHTDQASLESVLLNLTLNARDAMPKGGTINIETKVIQLEAKYVATLNEAMKAGAYACIRVTDTGTGMTPEVLERACEPFFTTKSHGRGTGLGLSMVYGFVIQCGGGVHIDSTPGVGTTISLYLPFAEDSSKSSGNGPHPTERRARSGVVLLVDDEEDLVRITALYLKALGYETLNAFDGADALRIAKTRNDIDVMLTDIVMPGGMDGVEVARLVRQLQPRIGIVYTSGVPSDAISERVLSTDDCLILQKPYQLSELGAAIDLANGRGLRMTSPV